VCADMLVKHVYIYMFLGFSVLNGLIQNNSVMVCLCVPCFHVKAPVCVYNYLCDLYSH